MESAKKTQSTNNANHVQFRLDGETIAAVDQLVAAHAAEGRKVSRPDMLRVLVKAALEQPRHVAFANELIRATWQAICANGTQKHVESSVVVAVTPQPTEPTGEGPILASNSAA